MDYLEFFENVKNSDRRVKYKILEVDSMKMEDGIPDFYKVINPIEVELEFADGIIRLAPYEALELLKTDYSYVLEGCIFATCNGEPVYVRNGIVYTCICGKNRIIEEKIADSIEKMFEEIQQNL